MIRVENLTKDYDGLRAVDGLSFSLEAGEILGLVGPNGAGKTSTLRCLVGILPPTEGRILLDGHDIAREPVPAKRIAAFIPDEPRLFDYLTVEEHLRFVARLYGVDDVAARAGRLLAELELAGRERSLPAELSRGMKQKLAIACGLLHDPRVLLFDEPLTGLDPMGIRRMKATIKARAEAGAAVIVSSHLLSLVEEICSRVLILVKGTKRLDGTLGELAARFPDLAAGARLEDVFLRATVHEPGDGDAADPPAPGGSE